MCGIVGLVGPNPIAEIPLLKRMTDAIAHRGPDGEGFWVDPTGSVGLGHRRLSIIDLSETGNQPMFYDDGRYAITFNGEIYNYIELRKELETRGRTFRSSSDTEVLLALFAEKREKCLDDLDGMYAFAIWDEKEKILFAARDRFGEKPFYYALHNGTLYFASEMKALWAAGVPREVSGSMLYNYLSNGFMYNPHDLSETFFTGIRKLRAAHYFYASIARPGVEQTRYWDLDPNAPETSLSEEEACGEFRRLFDESVRRRLRSDVPVGSSLSGGLDSSAIVCTIDRLKEGRGRQATFSARFPGFEKDEGPYMQAVIDATNVEPHFVFPDDFGLAEDIEKLIRHQEEPFGSASIYAQFCVMRLATEAGVTVLLDGQGADELLAGYHSYFDDHLRELRGGDNNRWRTELLAASAVRGSHKNGKPALKETLRAMLPSPVRRAAMRARRSIRNGRNSFLDPSFSHEHSREAFEFSTPARTLRESLRRHATRGPLEELLRYADRNSMAHSREVRLPFLSHELAEFLHSLPSNFKIRGGETKYILRRTFRGVVPDLVLDRRDKIGYEPPQRSWLDQPRMVELFEASAESLRARRILSNRAIEKVRKRERSATIFESDSWKVLIAASLLKP